MRRRFERELLRDLAPVWLACRWRIMGHSLMGKWPKPDLAFDLLGMCDYQSEMRILAKETLCLCTVRNGTKIQTIDG